MQEWFTRNQIAPVLQAHLRSYSDMDGPRRLVEVSRRGKEGVDYMCVCVGVFGGGRVEKEGCEREGCKYVFMCALNNTKKCARGALNQWIYMRVSACR